MAKKKSSITEERVRSVPEFVEAVGRVKALEHAKGNEADLLFRGQSCDKPLLPYLRRCEVKGELSNVEQLILKEFKRMSLPFREFEPRKRVGFTGSGPASWTADSTLGLDL